MFTLKKIACKGLNLCFAFYPYSWSATYGTELRWDASHYESNEISIFIV